MKHKKGQTPSAGMMLATIVDSVTAMAWSVIPTKNCKWHKRKIVNEPSKVVVIAKLRMIDPEIKGLKHKLFKLILDTVTWLRDRAGNLSKLHCQYDLEFQLPIA